MQKFYTMEGKTISGYTIKKRLGTGGMAEVWYAENRIGKSAAVKILLPELCRNENIVERFLTEAKTMVMLNHPYIRQVYDYGDIDGSPAIVMEYLDGDDLKTKMKKGQRFSDSDLIKWWNQLVDALKYTHSKGVVHRDIKPGNIFVDKDDNIKLLDFGIAKVRESISATQTGQKLGTLMYMSPEQVKDSKHIDYHTDIYSLAVTYVHLVTGRKPYDSDTSSDFEIQTDIVNKPLSLEGLPEKWRNFLAPYLNKEADKRPELRHFDDNAPIPQPVEKDEATIVDNGPEFSERSNTSEHLEKPAKPQKKSKLGLWIGIAAAVVVAAVVAVFALNGNDKSSDDNDKVAANIDKPLYPVYTRGEEPLLCYADATGKIVLRTQYEIGSVFNEGYAVVQKGDKFGVIDKSGKEIVAPKYDEISSFSEGLFAVELDGQYGFIDNTGKEVIALQYEDCQDFYEGMAAVKWNGKWGFINTKNRLIARNYDEVIGFNNGLAPVKKDDKWGYIDKTGKLVIPCSFDIARGFSESGLARVKFDGYWSYIDKSGYMAFPETYINAKAFAANGLAAVCDEYNWGFIDTLGNVVIDYQYTWIGKYYDGTSDYFSEFNDDGSAIVLDIDGDIKYGFIDESGNYLVEPKYKDVYGYLEGLYLVTEDDVDSAYFVDKFGNKKFTLYID